MGNMPSQRAFNNIVVRLCDNDFGYKIKQELEVFVANGLHKMLDPMQAEAHMRFMVAARSVTHRMDMEDPNNDEPRLEHMKRTLSYLKDCMHLTYDDKIPEGEDHDGGSAYIDIHSGFCSTF